MFTYPEGRSPETLNAADGRARSRRPSNQLSEREPPDNWLLAIACPPDSHPESLHIEQSQMKSCYMAVWPPFVIF